MKLLLAIIMAIAAFVYYFWRREEKRKKLLAYIHEHLSEIHTVVNQFSSRLKDFDAGYFTNQELIKWIDTSSKLDDVIKDNSYENLGLPAKETAAINQLSDYFQNAETFRNTYNKEFIARELQDYSSFFDNVENRKLDKQQRTAIVTDEDNNIIIAGAGSGKTTTIVGKVGYVIKKYKVHPEHILLISFTNKSATTLAQRINIAGVQANTFHKFGKEVIAEVEHKQPSIFDEAQYKTLLTGFFKDLLKNPAYLNKVTSYFAEFLKPVKSQDEFKNQGEYFQYLKDANFSTYKVKEVRFRGRITYKREVVKSIEECRIANFLLFNNINYNYEYPYEHETATLKHRQYKPDFTIHANDSKLYLEHFAINKSGQVPPFFANSLNGQTIEQATSEYTEGMKWKRELHKKHQTILIETYSHEMADGVLFDNLAKRLAGAGVEIRPKSPEESWKIISDSAKEEVEGFINLFQTFITLMKSNNYAIGDVSNRNKEVKNKFYHQRNSLFIQIISPIYEKYQNYLAERKEIDFSDMINKAANYISSGKYQKQFSYIIVDEFQDISIGRYQLLKAIKAANPTCKLFCVGDDWQSIYRFSGSDITLFNHFEKYFGYAERAKIETTYRFHNPLINFSSNFILKNPEQTKKELKSIISNKLSTHQIVYSTSENQDDSDALLSIFEELIRSGKATGKEIYILGRYSFDIDRIKNETNIFRIDKKNSTVTYTRRTAAGETVQISAQFMTVHKSKGLEADIVIVINCNSGEYGFPSRISDDPVLQLLLSESDQFENGEERRLFYVAMTRAKESVYFIADSSCKSKFITELEGENKDFKSRKCPKCITADLVKRSGVTNGKQWAFEGCSNFMYGCDYKDWLRT